MRKHTRLGAGVIVTAAVLLAGAAWVMAGAGQATNEKGVRLVRDDAKQRVEVFVDGQPFTAYIYPPTGKKPVLFPIRTREGHVRHARVPARAARRESASIIRTTSACGSTTAT